MLTIRSALKSSRPTVSASGRRTVFIGLLVLGIFAAGNKAGLNSTVRAQQDGQFPTKTAKQRKCNNATLAGRYATRGDGFVPSGPPPAPLVPFATVSLMTLDGSGNLSNTVTTSTNGVISSTVNPGTYTVNEDCTGEMTIMIPAPPFQLDFDLVIVDRGKEFYAIATTPSAVTVGGKRVD
jgi:hypothetical protein